MTLIDSFPWFPTRVVCEFGPMLRHREVDIGRLQAVWFGRNGCLWIRLLGLESSGGPNSPRVLDPPSRGVRGFAARLLISSFF